MIPEKTLLKLIVFITKASISSAEGQIALAGLIAKRLDSLTTPEREQLLNAVESERQKIKSLEEILRDLPS